MKMINFLSNLSSHRTQLGLLALIFGLASCTPLYETQYQYEPPESEAALACITECQKGKNLCQKHVNKTHRQCLRRERFLDLHSFRCQRLSHYYKGRDGKIYYYRDPSCFFPSHDFNEFCHWDNSQCEKTYQQCYQACGGQVIEKKVCVRSCDKVPKDTPPSSEK